MKVSRRARSLAVPRPFPICVHLSRSREIIAGGPFSCDRLAFPASELVQDRGSTPPVGVSTRMGEQVSELLPAPLGDGPLECEGLSNRLTGYRQL